MNMFAVTTGTYSDYRICGLYSTREKAEAVGAFIGSRIEEFPIDQELPCGKFWEIWMTLDGDILKGDIRRVDYSPDHVSIVQCAGGSFLIYTFGDNEQHAAKVANERRIAWKLENE